MPYVLTLLVLASSLALRPEPGSMERPDRQMQDAEAAADSVFFLVSGSLPCDAFEPIMESLVRRSDVREFVGSDCSRGQMDMVVEFEFTSEYELMRWQVDKDTRALLAPVFRTLKPLRLQIRATPRDPTAFRCNRRCEAIPRSSPSGR